MGIYTFLIYICFKLSHAYLIDAYLYAQSTVRQVHNTLLQKADNGYSDWQLDTRYGINYEQTALKHFILL